MEEARRKEGSRVCLTLPVFGGGRGRGGGRKWRAGGRIRSEQGEKLSTQMLGELLLLMLLILSLWL